MSKPEFKGTRVVFDCPTCQRRLAVSSEETDHYIVAGSVGVTVSPSWSCECGAVGKIENNNVLVTSRKKIPPEEKLPTAQDPGYRDAITIDYAEMQKEDDTDEAFPDPDDCPDRRRHGFFARKDAQCPTCGGRQIEPGTFVRPGEDTETLKKLLDEEPESSE